MKTMAKRGRPIAGPIKKYNPKYSRTSVRVAIQNIMRKGIWDDLNLPSQNRFVDNVMEELLSLEKPNR